MALTGFNPSIVKKSINSIMDSYEDLQDALVTVTQMQFVNPMSTLWCCKEAVQFFKSYFQPLIDNLTRDSYQTFQNVIETMNSAASNWAKRTGNTGDWRPVGFGVKVKQLNTSGIRDRNAQGEIGIDEAQAVVKAGLLLTKTFVKAQAAVNKASVSVRLCGFLGGTQASSLQKSLNRIKNNIENSVKESANLVKQSIVSSAEAYRRLGMNVSNTFSNLGSAAAMGGIAGAKVAASGNISSNLHTKMTYSSSNGKSSGIASSGTVLTNYGTVMEYK